ncbi:polymer-forming cytoskeletal protein [Sporolactobacillus sp. THM7-4]|nr:polymer-forming cytoskeletal protein [Sporolactobacillus sp. THM7-4]
MNRIRVFTRRQKGYALLLTLLVITLFSILGLMLISVSFNHTKQFTEETYRTQATNAAEMGLKDYNQKIGVLMSGMTQNKPSSFQEFENQLNNTPSLPAVYHEQFPNLQGEPEFDIHVTKTVNPSADRIQWTIRSIGTVQGESRTITQDKTFTFDSRYTGTPEYKGLSLPYMNGSAIVAPGNWNCNDHNNNHVSINGSTDNCIGATEENVDLSGVRSAFQSMSVASSSDDTVPVDSKGNMNADGEVKGNVYVAPGDGTINIPDHLVFDGNVYFGKDVTITGDAVFKGNVSVSGNLVVKGNVRIEGNILIGGNLDFNGGDVYEGYAYIGGDLSRGSDNGPKDSDTVFKRTVYINRNFAVKSNKASIQFEQGIVVQGEASPKTSANGSITIGHQQRGTDDSTLPVTVTTNNTNYQ